MKKTTLALTAVALLSACGGGGGGGGGEAPVVPAADLDPRLAGAWPGTLTVTPRGYASSSAPGTLEVAVAGRSATISKVCPDGSGSLVATGSDRAAAWSGSLACPPVAVGPCPSVVATLTSATGTLSADGLTLTVDALGTATGCFTTLGLTMSFVGAK
jgi:hypothetical protein